MSTFHYLVANVEQWAGERGIIEHSNPQSQLLKAVSELGELCDAEVKASQFEQQDAVGDVLVCLIIYCRMKGYNIEGCLAHAYDEIKNRKGKMSSGGAFVKDE
jgi:NTP pyrophosphatase (non-canonical NTP hydrolase)